MCDPLSVVSTAAVALHAIRKAKEFVDGIQGAPRTIEKLSGDFHAIEEPLRNIQSLLNGIQHLETSIQTELYNVLHNALGNCQKIATDLECLLRPFIKNKGDARRSIWKRFSWSFKEQKVADIRSEMAVCKQSLNMAISCANLMLNSRSNKQAKKLERGVKQIRMHFGIDNMSVADSDYVGSVDTTYERNISVKQWITETETVVEEGEEEDPEIEKFGEDTNAHLQAIHTRAQAMGDRLPIAGGNLGIRGLAPKETFKDPPPPVKKRGLKYLIADHYPNACNAPRLPFQPNVSKPNHQEGQLIRKTIVSRWALERMNIKFTEQDKYVHITHKIDGDRVQELRRLSSHLCADHRLWWSDQPSPATTTSTSASSPLKPATRYIPLPPPQPSSPFQSAVQSLYPKLTPKAMSQTPTAPPIPESKPQGGSSRRLGSAVNNPPSKHTILRKTIVSKAALQRSKIQYHENAKHITIPSKLDRETVQELRRVSLELDHKPQNWW